MGFYSDIEIGTKGEDAIYDYLISHPSTFNVINVSDDEWFQQFDIDFIQVATGENYDINKIEVKTDRIADKTGNIVYEVFSDRRFHTKGCFEKTHADYIFYYLINTKILYIFNTQELRQWVYEHRDKLRLANMGDYALGYIIPLNDLKDIYIKERL